MVANSVRAFKVLYNDFAEQMKNASCDDALNFKLIENTYRGE